MLWTLSPAGSSLMNLTAFVERRAIGLHARHLRGIHGEWDGECISMFSRDMRDAFTHRVVVYLVPCEQHRV